MTLNRSHKWYGYLPDLPDARDFQPSFKIKKATALPQVVDLRPSFRYIPILNQGPLGSCTANAIAVAHMAAQMKVHGEEHPVVPPSRLFIYYNERNIEGTVPIDAGAMIRDGIKSIARDGVCDEKIWPYKISQFRVKPNTLSYKDAQNHQAISYERLHGENLDQLLSCLASGFPFVFGFSVYSSFESSTVERTGVYAPNPLKEELVGGHAVICFGYDRLRGTFTIRNSWGADWGLDGYFTMRMSDVSNWNMCDDFWVVKVVE